MCIRDSRTPPDRGCSADGGVPRSRALPRRSSFGLEPVHAAPLGRSSPEEAPVSRRGTNSRSSFE
eukprot:855713-Alexandrium_andersonii.AAC.1